MHDKRLRSSTSSDSGNPNFEHTKEKVKQLPLSVQPPQQLQKNGIVVVQDDDESASLVNIDSLGLFARQTTGKFKMFIHGGLLQVHFRPDYVDLVYLIEHPSHKDNSQHAIAVRRQLAYPLRIKNARSTSQFIVMFYI